jgi:hypothetical protein
MRIPDQSRDPAQAARWIRTTHHGCPRETVTACAGPTTAATHNRAPPDGGHRSVKIFPVHKGQLSVVCLDQRLRHRPPWFASGRAVDRYRWVVSSLLPSSFDSQIRCAWPSWCALCGTAGRSLHLRESNRRRRPQPLGTIGDELDHRPVDEQVAVSRYLLRSSWAIPGPAIDPNASSVAAMIGTVLRILFLPLLRGRRRSPNDGRRSEVGDRASARTARRPRASGSAARDAPGRTPKRTSR